MADTKISALTSVTAVTDADEFAVNQSFVSKKCTAAQVKSDIVRVVAVHDANHVTAEGATILPSAPEGYYFIAARIKWTTVDNSSTLIVNFSDLGILVWSNADSITAVPTVGSGNDYSYAFIKNAAVQDFYYTTEYTGNDYYEFSIVVEKIPSSGTVTHRLTLNTTGVAATMDPVGPVFADGTTVVLTAEAGFSFWFGDVPAGHENDNPLTVVMDRARYIEPSS